MSLGTARKTIMDKESLALPWGRVNVSVQGKGDAGDAMFEH
jgi:hypothetical protein